MVEPYIMPIIWGRGGINVADIAEAGVQVEGNLICLFKRLICTHFFTVQHFFLLCLV